MTKLITVYGMTSENCRRMITRELEKVNHVNKVSISLANRLIEVTFDEKNISLNEIRKFVHKLGYDPL